MLSSGYPRVGNLSPEHEVREAASLSGSQQQEAFEEQVQRRICLALAAASLHSVDACKAFIQEAISLAGNTAGVGGAAVAADAAPPTVVSVTVALEMLNALPALCGGVPEPDLPGHRVRHIHLQPGVVDGGPRVPCSWR